MYPTDSSNLRRLVREKSLTDLKNFNDAIFGRLLRVQIRNRESFSVAEDFGSTTLVDITLVDKQIYSRLPILAPLVEVVNQLFCL